MIWRSLRELPAWVRLLVLGRFISAVGALAWLYLAVFLVRERGVEPSLAGIIVGANGLGLMLGNLLGGWLGDRFGNKRMLFAGYLGWAVLCASFPYLGTGLLLPISVAAGFAAGSAHPIGVALVAAAVPPEQRRMGIAITRAAMNAGIVIGPPIGALLAAHNFSLIFIVDSMTSLVLAGIVLRWVPSTPRPSKVDYQRGFVRAVLRDRQVMVLIGGAVVLDVAFRQLYTGLPLMLADQLISYGVLIAGSCLLIVLLETPLAIVLARHPALRLVASGWALVALGLLMLGIWPSLGGAIVAVTVITFGEMLYKPSAPAFAADRAPEGMQGRYQSLYSAASISGFVISPPLGGFLYQHAPQLLWPVSSALAIAATLMLTLFAFALHPKKQPVAQPVASLGAEQAGRGARGSR